MVGAMAQPMRAWERRGLSAGEIALGREIFADAIDWTAVRLLQLPPLPLPFGAMAPFGRTIVFGRWRAARDFTAASLNEQGWFVHELAHVWQAGRGKVLGLSKLAALGKQAYRYKPRAGAKLASYNIESQAEIVRHLFLARAGERAPLAPDAAWLEDIWAKR
jgi:hypothetical protein